VNARDRRGIVHVEQTPHRAICGAVLPKLAFDTPVTCEHCEGLLELHDGTYQAGAGTGKLSMPSTATVTDWTCR
jgi:hypothetical protein